MEDRNEPKEVTDTDLKLADVPARFRKYTPDFLTKKEKEFIGPFVKGFKNNPYSLPDSNYFLYGDRAEIVSTAICYYVLSKRMRVYFLDFKNIKMINKDYSDIKQHCRDVDLLVINDFGISSSRYETVDNIDYVSSLVLDRYNAMKPTVIISVKPLMDDYFQELYSESMRHLISKKIFTLAEARNKNGQQ